MQNNLAQNMFNLKENDTQIFIRRSLKDLKKEYRKLFDK